jgi:hypothetical protein
MMRNNDLSQDVWPELLVISIDADALFIRATTKKWLFWKKTTLELSKHAHTVFNTLKGHLTNGNIDRVVIVCNDHASKIKEIINDTFGLPFDVLFMSSEDMLKKWLLVTNPSMHFTTLEKRYICRQAILLDDDFKKYFM